MAALLELHDVARSFGSVQAVRGFSMRVAEGEAVGIVGPNGAGKTTVLNLIAGTTRADRGRIVFGGVDITRMRAHLRPRLGIGRTFQIPRPFAGLTAYENVLVAHTYGRRRSARGTAKRDCAAALELVGLATKENTSASALTLLERKRLELARALATEPRVLLLDEIAGGLTEPEVQALVETVLGVRARGVAIVWIEHVLHALVSTVDRLVAVAQGEVLLEGTPAHVMASPALRDVYLGQEL
ncbi:MAG: ABC transporter ATP-binding protein [Gaiellaceae bacterium]